MGTSEESRGEDGLEGENGDKRMFKNERGEVI